MFFNFHKADFQKKLIFLTYLFSSFSFSCSFLLVIIKWEGIIKRVFLMQIFALDGFCAFILDQSLLLK